jgi:hypothetical protein
MAAELAAVKPMKIKEIKAELEERGVEWRDLLEKNEFVQRLVEARVKGITKPAPPVEEEGKKEEEVKAAEQPRAESSSSSSPPKEEPAAAAAAAAEAATPKMDEAARRYSKALAEVMKLKVRCMAREEERKQKMRKREMVGWMEGVKIKKNVSQFYIPSPNSPSLLSFPPDHRNQERARPAQDPAHELLRKTRICGSPRPGPRHPPFLRLHHQQGR